MTKKNILITGNPGVGKTTLIKKLIIELNDFNPIGFYTEEIRREGVRCGFELVSLDGRRMLLAHTGIKSHYKVGKYGVDVKGFEDFLDSIKMDALIIIIDEIGKMECFSQKFRRLLKEILDSMNVIIATIALRGDGFIEGIKKRPDVVLWEITKSNRDTLLPEILKNVIQAIEGR